jgi:hypothetical protein
VCALSSLYEGIKQRNFYETLHSNFRLSMHLCLFMSNLISRKRYNRKRCWCMFTCSVSKQTTSWDGRWKVSSFNINDNSLFLLIITFQSSFDFPSLFSVHFQHKMWVWCLMSDVWHTRSASNVSAQLGGLTVKHLTPELHPSAQRWIKEFYWGFGFLKHAFR